LRLRLPGYFYMSARANARLLGRVRSIPVVLGCLACIAASPALAQFTPKLVGSISVDLPAGSLAGNLCISDIPLRGDTVWLVLNRAHSIKRISGVAGPARIVELEPGGTGVRYAFLKEDQTGDLPSSTTALVCVEYGGSFPTYDVDTGDFRDDDGSHLVAFNGRAIRARGISRWHPTTYDPGTGLAAEAVRFDVEVECRECVAIHVNGSPTVPGPIARFASMTPRELLLIAGDLSVQEHAGVTFVGEALEMGASDELVGAIVQTIGILEEYTSVPYGPPPNVVRIAPLRAPVRGQLWGFYSDPSFALIGMSVAELDSVLANSEGRGRRSVLGFLGHELAHRYFGFAIGAGSAQRDLFGEPFATFLELKVVRRLFGEGEYNASVDRLRRQAVSRGPTVPLAHAIGNDFAESTYRYGFAPAALLSLEAAIGEEVMRATITSMLTAPESERFMADLGFIVDHAARVGANPAILADWMRGCAEADAIATCLPATP